MSSFLGTDPYAIDHKGRIAIPADMRKQASQGKRATSFFLNRGFDGCVAVYSRDEWNRMMAMLRRISPGNPRGRAFRRAFMEDAREVTVDAQGRIPIPSSLMRRAGLGKEAILHGADTHIEIWDPDRYRAALAPVTDVDGEYERLASELIKDEDA